VLRDEATAKMKAFNAFAYVETSAPDAHNVGKTFRSLVRAIREESVPKEEPNKWFSCIPRKKKKNSRK